MTSATLIYSPPPHLNEIPPKNKDNSVRPILLLTILMLNKQIFKSCCFWQSKNTISFIYTLPNCTEEQQYILILL